jgi:hypothetical protein
LRRSDFDRDALRAGSHHLANPLVNTKKAPAKAGAFFGCESQKGASSGCAFSVAGAVGADSLRSNLRIENALICHAVI